MLGMEGEGWSASWKYSRLKISHNVEAGLAGSHLCLQAMTVLLEVPQLAFNV